MDGPPNIDAKWQKRWLIWKVFKRQIYTDRKQNSSFLEHAAAAKSLQSCPTLCDPMAAHQALSSLGFSRQEHWSGMPFLSSWSMREHQIQTANAKSGSYWDDGSVNWIVVVVKLSKFTKTYWIIHLKHVHVMICTLYLNQEKQLIIKIHNDLRSFCLVILLCPFILLLVKHFFSISWLNMYL